MLINSFEVGCDVAKWMNVDYEDLVRHHAYEAYHPLNGACYREGSVYEPYLRSPEWRGVGVSLLTTSGGIRKHTDALEMGAHCYHAILLNDGFIAKGTGQRVYSAPAKLVKQKKGMIIQLNIHCEHALVKDVRTFNPSTEYPTWATLCFNSSVELTNEEIVDRFNKAVPLLQAEVEKLQASNAKNYR
jgi:hypothetical protein